MWLVLGCNEVGSKAGTSKIWNHFKKKKRKRAKRKRKEKREKKI